MKLVTLLVLLVAICFGGNVNEIDDLKQDTA